MKYVAECGDQPVFESEQACIEYERVHGREMELQAEQSKYLDLQDWSGCKTEQALKRERTKAEKILHGWLAHDIRQHPERYGVEFDEYGKVNDVLKVRSAEVA